MMSESSTLLLNLEEKEVRALNLVVLLVCGEGYRYLCRLNHAQ